MSLIDSLPDEAYTPCYCGLAVHPEGNHFACSCGRRYSASFAAADPLPAIPASRISGPIYVECEEAPCDDIARREEILAREGERLTLRIYAGRSHIQRGSRIVIIPKPRPPWKHWMDTPCGPHPYKPKNY